MNSKCNGYESQFIFLNNEDFAKHLKTCKSCREEHEKMQKVSELIKEVKPHFISFSPNFLQKVAIITLTILAGFILQYFLINTGVYSEYLSTDNSVSAEDLGFPVDEYGFLMVD